MKHIIPFLLIFLFLSPFPAPGANSSLPFPSLAIGSAESTAQTAASDAQESDTAVTASIPIYLCNAPLKRVRFCLDRHRLGRLVHQCSQPAGRFRGKLPDRPLGRTVAYILSDGCTAFAENDCILTVKVVSISQNRVITVTAAPSVLNGTESP